MNAQGGDNASGMILYTQCKEHTEGEGLISASPGHKDVDKVWAIVAVPEGSGASYRTCKLVKTRADLTKARKNDELAKKKDVPELWFWMWWQIQPAQQDNGSL